jgi:hypothetical protein
MTTGVVTQVAVLPVPTPVPTPVPKPDPTAPATSVESGGATSSPAVLPVEIVIVVASLLGALSFIAIQARRPS